MIPVENMKRTGTPHGFMFFVGCYTEFMSMSSVDLRQQWICPQANERGSPTSFTRATRN